MPFPLRRLGAAVLAVTLAAPAAATAATVEVDGSVLRYTAAPGERNELTVMLQSGRFTIQEGQNGATPITAVAPCTEAPRDSMGGSIGAYCPPDGVDRIVIDLGDGDDRASVGVMARTDYPTDLFGGEGNDEIHAGGGRPDHVDCGNGTDVAYGDLDTDVFSNCESERAISAESPQTSDGTAVRDAPLSRRRVDLPRAVSLRTLRRRGLRARVRCPSACRVRLLLYIRDAQHLVRTVGEGGGRRGAGWNVVRGRLSTAGARRVGRASRLLVTIRVRDASGRWRAAYRVVRISPAEAAPTRQGPGAAGRRA